MGNIKDKLEYLNETKNLIRKAIRSRQVSVSDNDSFRSYAEKIESIPVTAEVDVNSLEVTENKEYDAGEGKAYNPVTVNVQPKLKDLDITNDGTYKVEDEQEQDPDLYGYEKVTVDTSKHLMEKEITAVDFPETLEAVTFVAKDEVPEEDKDDPDKAVYGYSKFKIDISGKVGNKEVEIDARNTQQVTYEAKDDQLYGYDKIVINILEDQGPYDIEFWNENTKIDTYSVPKFGNALTYYNHPAPEKKGYRFVGWDPNPVRVTSNMACYAKFSKTSSKIGIDGTIIDSWANIGASGGADIPLGSHKAISYPDHTYDLGNGVTFLINNGYLDMVKVASKEEGTTSTWVSSNILTVMVPFYTTDIERESDFLSWANSNMRKYLNETLLSAIGSLSGPGYEDQEGIVDYIVPVFKTTASINRELGFVSDYKTYDDKLWIPSAYECGYLGYETYGTSYEAYMWTGGSKPQNIGNIQFALRSVKEATKSVVVKESDILKAKCFRTNGKDPQMISYGIAPGINSVTTQNIEDWNLSVGNTISMAANVIGGTNNHGLYYAHMNHLVPSASRTSAVATWPSELIQQIRIGFCT